MSNINFLKITAKILALSLLNFCAVNAAALDILQATRSNGDLSFYLDTAGFRSSFGQTLQEFYYQIPLAQLEFCESEQGYKDTVYTKIDLFDSLEQNVYSDSSIIPLLVNELSSVQNRYLPDQFELLLNPGEYRLNFVMTERGGQRSGQVSLPFTAREFKTEHLVQSDIQFSSEIRQDTTESKFVKNGLKVVPNPSRVYDFSLPMLYFYCEIYNLSYAGKTDTSSHTYQIKYDILTPLGDIAKSLPAKLKKKPGSSSVEVGAVYVGTLPDTLYQLRLSLLDNDTGIKSSATGVFRLLPLQLATGPQNEAVVAIQNMSDEEIQKHLRQLKYILTRDEMNLMSGLGADRLRAAIANYWFSVDPSPQTPQNEFWREFMGRIELANKKFAAGFEEGWLTDRGRIMIKYGIPDNINRHPMTVHSVPYVEWFYYREEGMKFIFADEEGFNRYRLIYSSDERELTDPNWSQIINAF